MRAQINTYTYKLFLIKLFFISHITFKNVNVYFRKKLLETVEFIKKCVALPPQIPQTSKAPAVQCQKETITNVEETEKHKILTNLPKIGVYSFLILQVIVCMYMCI